jgi:hypothetical protein
VADFGREVGEIASDGRELASFASGLSLFAEQLDESFHVK